jgi:hypothetical protein
MPTAVAPARPNGNRRPLIAAAAVLGVALLVGGVFLGRWWATPPGSADAAAMLPTMTYGTGGDLTTFAYSSSDGCYNGRLAAGYKITSDNQVNCDKNHDFEVYAVGGTIGNTYSSDSDATFAAYPGSAMLNRLAEAQCALSFYSDMVDGTQRGQLKYRALVPSVDAWAERPGQGEDPNRAVYCVATRSDAAQLSASIVAKVK